MACEWDPSRDRKARLREDVHADAVWSVGARGQWHLCEACAALPRFSRYRVRVRLKPSA